MPNCVSRGGFQIQTLNAEKGYVYVQFESLKRGYIDDVEFLVTLGTISEGLCCLGSKLGFWYVLIVWILVCSCLFYCIYYVLYWYVWMLQWHSVSGDSGDHFLHVDWTVLSKLSTDEYSTGAVFCLWHLKKHANSLSIFKGSIGQHLLMQHDAVQNSGRSGWSSQDDFTKETDQWRFRKLPLGLARFF